MNADQMFFFKHAGYSWDPMKETQEEGRARCAIELADAESKAREAGFSFDWDEDADTNSSDFSDEEPAYALWMCLCFNEDGETIAALGGIDLGRDGAPHNDPYRRVVEAELALEALS